MPLYTVSRWSFFLGPVFCQKKSIGEEALIGFKLFGEGFDSKNLQQNVLQERKFALQGH